VAKSMATKLVSFLRSMALSTPSVRASDCQRRAVNSR
jgi:hypothetical protein